MIWRFRQAGAACLGATLLVSLGCWSGSDLEIAPVTGTIYWNGEPQGQLEVCFLPESGRPSYAETRPDGTYELGYTGRIKGALVGNHSVQIRGAREGDGENPGVREFLPAKYHDRTELTAVVEPRNNQIDFHLTTN